MPIILSVILWILFALLMILLIFLFMPICIAVEIDYDKPKVWLKILFLKFQLYPIKEKNKNEKTANDKTQEQKEEELKKAEEKAKKANKKALPKINFEKIIAILHTAGTAIKIVFRGLFFTKIQILYPIYKEDSAQTAIAYGQTQAYFGGIAATLQNFINLSFKNVEFIADFTGEHKYRRYFYCNIWSTTFIIIVAGIYAIIKLKKENII